MVGFQGMRMASNPSAAAAIAEVRAAIEFSEKRLSSVLSSSIPIFMEKYKERAENMMDEETREVCISCFFFGYMALVSFLRPLSRAVSRPFLASFSFLATEISRVVGIPEISLS